MKTFSYAFVFCALSFFTVIETVNAQSAVKSSILKKGLFDSETILEITLSGNLRPLMNDRKGDSKYYPVSLAYKDDNGNEIVTHTEIKTRGHFRKVMGNCLYPPLLINFSKEEASKSSLFKEQNKLKLVMPCSGDEYVIREWLIYKLYNLVSAKSFRARLVSVRLNNTKNNKTTSSFYGILLEEEKQMAKRNASVALTKRMEPEDIERQAFLNMAVFEYLIGNTDWCVQYLQNIKLIAADSNAVPVTVPYDFDHAGLVNAPYAQPAEALLMRSVRERRYRGFCIQDIKQFDSAIALYNSLKEAIYNTYTSCTLLDAKYVKATLKYLDEFYATINSPDALQKEFGYPCDKNGTGNVLIKGLRED